MDGPYIEIIRRIERFLDSRGKFGLRQLGWGWDGVVIQSSSNSAVKGFKFIEHFRRERDVYLRLRGHGVEKVQGFAVPALLDFDEALMVIEMSIVSPPYVLDFAGARLDSPAEFPSEVLEEWERDKEELFEDEWPIVRSIMAEFERFGIYLGDVHPGNIRFKQPG